MLTDAEIRAKLSAAAAALGSRARLADTYGISPSYLANLILGKKPFTPAILTRLGLPEEADSRAAEIGEKDVKYRERSEKVQSVRHKTSHRHHIGRGPVGPPVPKPLLAQSGNKNNGDTNDDDLKYCDDINKIRYSYNKPPLTPEEREENKKRFFRRMKRDMLCIEKLNSKYGKLMYSYLIQEGNVGIIDE